MPPVPTELSAAMFGGLEGKKFTQATEILKQLMAAKSTIRFSSGQTLSLESAPVGLRDDQIIKFSHAMLIRGEAFPNFLAFVERNDFIPKYFQETNTKLISEGFSIEITYNEQFQWIEVSQRGNDERVVKLQHDGLQVPITTSNRSAIGALAVLPDNLWESVCKQGLVVGVTEGDHYDDPIHVAPYAIMLPDPKGKLSWRKDPGILQSFSIRDLNRAMGEPEAAAYLKSLEPVAVLGDMRESV